MIFFILLISHVNEFECTIKKKLQIDVHLMVCRMVFCMVVSFNVKKVSSMVDVVATVSIISSIFSIILAVYAIQFSRRVEERLKNNFLILKETMEANQKQAQECLSNIDREAEAIKKTVDQSHEKLHETLQDIKLNNKPPL
jgi:hypothetical protein